ncbi:TPA: fimbrial protein [Salmonella enterica]|nr:fimbrial protein [Salmonella enterica subsp. enterica]
MKGRFLNLKTLLPLLVLLTAISNPAQAEYDAAFCMSSGAGSLVIRNINLKGGALPGNTTLQLVPLTISYTCTLYQSSINYQPTLYLLPGASSLVNALKASGLAMEIIISESGGTTGTLSWVDIQNSVNSSGRIEVPFGPVLGKQPGSHTGTASLSLRIFTDAKGVTVTTPKNISVPATMFKIIPFHDKSKPFSDKGTKFQITPFNINIIPDNSGAIAVAPDLIRMGHFYTGDVSSQTKQASFTVTALQKAGVGNNGTPFTIPLGIEFRPTNHAILADVDKTIKLINTNGNLTGLGLTIEEDSGGPVTFNKTAPMGDIMMGTGATGRVVKTYTATVAPISGETINTGDFTAAISIIVTYQ